MHFHVYDACAVLPESAGVLLQALNSSISCKDVLVLFLGRVMQSLLVILVAMECVFPHQYSI